MINQSEKQAELKLAARSPPDILCHRRPSEIIGLLIFFFFTWNYFYLSAFTSTHNSALGKDSTSKTINNDGVWFVKRQLDDEIPYFQMPTS